MAWTLADLVAVETAIASGEQFVQFQDRTVTYRSIPDLLEARDAIKASLMTRSKQTLLVGSKGLEPRRCL